MHHHKSVVEAAVEEVAEEEEVEVVAVEAAVVEAVAAEEDHLVAHPRHKPLLHPLPLPITMAKDW